MAKAKAKIVTKAKKKEWIPIIAPKIFSNQQLGDIYIENPQQAIGRQIEYNLRELTNNNKDQNTYISFEIKSEQEGKLTTQIVGYSISNSSIKRLIRKNSMRIDQSFIVETSDGKKTKIKPLVLTAFKGQHSIGTSIRKKTEKELSKEISKLNFGNLIDKLISYKLQTGLKKKLNDIYPIKFVAIKEMKILSEKEIEEEEKKEERKEQENKIEAKPKKPKKKEEKEKEKAKEKEKK